MTDSALRRALRLQQVPGSLLQELTEVNLIAQALFAYQFPVGAFLAEAAGRAEGEQGASPAPAGVPWLLSGFRRKRSGHP